jgi:hypothetical protein
LWLYGGSRFPPDSTANVSAVALPEKHHRMMSRPLASCRPAKALLSIWVRSPDVGGHTPTSHTKKIIKTEPKK